MTLQAWLGGDWRNATLLGVGRNGSLSTAELARSVASTDPVDPEIPVDPGIPLDPTGPVTAPTSFVTFSSASASATLHPIVVLRSGGTQVPVWRDMSGNRLATGLTPSLTGQTAYRLDTNQDIIVLNFGYNAWDDWGDYMPSTDYQNTNYSTALTGISGLQALPNLRYFLASHTQFTGMLDISGMKQMLSAETEQSYTTGININGCTNLDRLGLEGCSLTELDLNPVRSHFKDLRAAAQRGGSLNFVTLGAPMRQMTHYCMRENNNTNVFPFAMLPVIREWMAWGANIYTIDTPVSPYARDFEFFGNPLTEEALSNVLRGLANNSTINNGVVVAYSTRNPTTEQQAYITTLRNRSWSVTVRAGG